MAANRRSDNQSRDLFGPTPSQTVGPFFHFGLPWKGGADLVGCSDLGARPELFPDAHYVLNVASPQLPPKGEVIEIIGRVLDGEGKPVPDAMIEIWQANAAGRYAGPGDTRDQPAPDENFVGFGRASTSEDGEYRFRTILPGRVPGPCNSLQARHVAVAVFARGLLRHLFTRIYFTDPQDSELDPILEHVPEHRRHTLLATQEAEGLWRFNIVLQGPNETVFFAL